MNRLKHSYAGYRRRMQISHYPLFIFIEGYKDNYIYSQIIEHSEWSKHGIKCDLRTAEDLPGQEGGKRALLGFFEYLRGNSSLVSKFNRKTSVVIFFLDKDIDDFLGETKKSKHIVYTKTYHIQNYLFLYSRISEASAALASLAVDSLRAGLGDYKVWRKRVAKKWKKWVKLCFLAQKLRKGFGIKPECNYSRKSQVNNDNGRVNKTKYKKYLLGIENESGLSRSEFKRFSTQIFRKVDRLYSKGQHDSVFKGEWYASFIIKDIKRIAGRRKFNHNRLNADNILNNLALQLNFDDVWTKHFKNPIRRLLIESGILRR